MKTTCILVSLVASAAAFAPTNSPQKMPISSLNSVDFKNEVGAQMPLGMWDPMGMVGAGDQTRFDRLREVEVKHGRIS